MNTFKIIILVYLLTVVSADSLQTNIMPRKILETDERIRSQGYPAETHIAETKDGYALKIFRIPYSHKLQNQNLKRSAILLVHGLYSNSDCWLSTGPDYALAYLLADAGFDVWLGNARGNIYSRNNTQISSGKRKFWRFDWHQIGIIDIPTIIDFIIAETGEQKIHYAGHSQGTTVYFVMMSERPEYNMKIRSAHMLAPCAFFEHTNLLTFKWVGDMVGRPGGAWNRLLENRKSFSQSFITIGFNSACGSDSTMHESCKKLWKLFLGETFMNTNLTALQVLLETHPAGASTNQGIHYIRLSDYNKGRFCQMDYGPTQNKKVYGHEKAPDYNLANIKVPTYLYSGANDSLCSSKDVDTLAANIPHLAGNYRVPLESFNHLDFIIARNVRELVNYPIIRNIFKHE